MGDRRSARCSCSRARSRRSARWPIPTPRLTIWDNSNIVESYSGVTTPLTFSFAREIYQHVYRQFCRMMGVPERVIAGARRRRSGTCSGWSAAASIYNLLNWYRVLALLPGYREPAVHGADDGREGAAARRAGRRDRAASAARARSLDALYARAHGRRPRRESPDDRPRRSTRSTSGSNDALAPPAPPLEDRRPDELVAHYRDLRRRLLLSWDAPLVNDFFAMIFYGLLRSLVDRAGAAMPRHAAERSDRRRRRHGQRRAGGADAAAGARSPPRTLRCWILRLTSGTLDEILAALDGHARLRRRSTEATSRSSAIARSTS